MPTTGLKDPQFVELGSILIFYAEATMVILTYLYAQIHTQTVFISVCKKKLMYIIQRA